MSLNLAFIEPYGTLDVHLVDDVVVALVAFFGVAFAVSTLLTLAMERTRVAQRHADELEGLERARDAQHALLRSVSHDLRTPLAAIQGITTDLRDTGASHDDATRRELLGVVSDEAERLDRLVANLLSLSRVEAGALTPEIQAVDLEELLDERVRRLARLLHDVHVDVRLPEILPLVDADYTLAEQVITNLLENAASHAPAGSALHVDVREIGDEVEVAVSDEGPGVPPGDRASIFEPFRSGGASRSTGIGLAICKAIVEAHGGTITVDDAAGGQGARFAFTLPVHWVRPEPFP